MKTKSPLEVENDRLRAILGKLYDACKVIATTAHIQHYLAVKDPMALKQIRDAISAWENQP